MRPWAWCWWCSKQNERLARRFEGVRSDAGPRSVIRRTRSGEGLVRRRAGHRPAAREGEERPERRTFVACAVRRDDLDPPGAFQAGGGGGLYRLRETRKRDQHRQAPQNGRPPESLHRCSPVLGAAAAAVAAYTRRIA